jgi:DNA-binding NtrC family response regulator
VVAERTHTETCESLEAMLDRPVAGVTARDWKKGNLPYGEPDFVLFDLRRDAAWDTLEEWTACNRGADCVTVPWIGIVNDCIPLSRAVAADQGLSGFVEWPVERNVVARALRLARKRMVARGPQPSGEWRELAGTQRNFRTYEPALFPVLNRVAVAARHDFTVLLTAETGTGKTTLAQIIHENSPRRDSRFLTVACASLPRELIESELFGHSKGAFTGADKSKEGKFDAAKGGTILLDEIDVLEPAQQAKLLRVLETGQYEPVGSNETRTTSARCIVASNFCLEQLVREGRFRQDLYFRLNQVRFEIPPLRNRPRDLVPIMTEVVAECCKEHKLKIRGLSPALLESAATYSWPGNVRELRNEVRRCVLFAENGIVRPDSFSESVAGMVDKALEHAAQVSTPSGLAGSIAQTEQQTIEAMLRTQKFNRAATARALGISRVTLYNKLRRYNIRVDEAEEK